ncbi:MAG TPA: lipopolysaccharide biosynthesis protein [Polyangia bacterium]|jgi:O-antigen/teichoic acid export membrane protein|nr:lipopolysaccharide biosynthesis protein [Polyangia bacterium]
MSTAEAPAPAGESAAKTVAGGVLFIGFAKVYFMLTGFAQRVLLTRLIGPADFGDFAVVNNVISIFNNTLVQGTIQGVSKLTAEDDARAGAVQRAGLRLQAGLGLAVALALFIAAPQLAALEHAPRFTPYFRIAALVPFFYAMYAVFVGSANGLRRFRTQASFDVGFSTTKTFLLLGFAVLWKVMGAFIGFAAAAAVILVVASRVMRLPPSAQPFPIRRIAPFVWAVLAYTILLNLALNSDLLLLRHFALQAPGMDAVSAAAVAGNYEALRTFALLPYQTLLVVTFVIFPLVSRATFAADREATRAYVTQTMRYALILAGVMGIVLAARPAALFGVIYKPEYGAGAAALPILAAGQCCLALLSVACSILNAAGRTRATLTLMAVTLAVGAGGVAILVPHSAAGTPMLIAAATATAIATGTGLIAALVVLRTRFGGGPPLATVVRVGLAMAAAVVAARLVPGHGKVLGLAVMALAGIAYVAVLLVTREFGPADRAKFAKIIRR